MTHHVPDDFPYASAIGSLPGAQVKFIVSRDVDGRLREPGDFLSSRERDHRLCIEILEWGTDFLREKSLKPKYAWMTREQLLAKLDVNLTRDFGLPVRYRRWILAHLATRLGWENGADASPCATLSGRAR